MKYNGNNPYISLFIRRYATVHDNLHRFIAN